MMKEGLLIFSLIGLFSVCVGQFIQNGQCDPNIQLADDFQINEFLGSWNEIARSPSPTQDGECSGFEFNRATATAPISVRRSSVRQNFLVEDNGVAEPVGGAPRFNLNFGANNVVDFRILRTDNTNFVLAYSCENINNLQRSVYIWHLSRNASYPNEMTSALMNTTMFNIFGINASDLYTVSHSNFSCYILPVINQGQPIILPGQCDANIPVVQNFNVSRFLGLWHEIASYHSERALGQCNRAEYRLINNVVNVENSQVTNQTLQTVSGTATVNSTDGSARLNVVLNVGGANVEEQLWVLATDYDSYAISYSCTNLPNNTRRVFSWILSRTRELTATAQVQVNQAVDSIIELNNAYYTQSDQSDAACFYYPTPVPNQSVTFRGRCSDNIPVVQNFDAARYMGLWHEIESYPTTFQGGTCSNAFYSLSSAGVDVFNTQVVNQTLDTINGVAVLASTDGSARLLVTFPIGNTNQNITTNYWVVATDYVTYALVYSCTDLSNDQRQVTSWKLSRTKQMPAAATTAINNAISNIDVLDQRYYQVTDQTPAGCFYIPEPQPGVPVVFPGQCDTNVRGLANFNFNQFQGTWYEIQAYPKEQQPGQCVSHQFNTGITNMYNLVSIGVYDQFQSLTNSVVTVAANETRGEMTISMTVNGTTISFPYHILATDYTSYALAYSCVNINNDFRGIWSWKLSRARTLTAAANTAINTAIAPIQVLDNMYYENIDHSENACFYLPELGPNEPIILPGQCDRNISVVQNFNAARYLGRWRLIESYPADPQVGTCNEATYSLGANGVVEIYNTQVVNQALSTINGTATAAVDGSGRLNVTFPNIPEPFEYWILDTDYDNYALVYGCVNINAEQRRVWSWKLSRTNTLSTNAVNAINQVINRVQVLNNRYYQSVNRSDAACFYYPTPDNNPVVFRGQCDQNIPVFQNFNASLYMGLWHDIQSYPTPFQGGTCNNAYYTLNGATVEVRNTQVIGQTLNTITGTGVIASTDGSARLLITFPTGTPGQTSQADYWILGTDYNSYSILYSCRNINNEERQVTSWKLSRSKQLTAAANTAINTVISTVDVLDQRYYLTRNQTPSGCFYFPEPQPGVPVVFPGQCDTNINVAQNFNMTQFAGMWYEIETYPRDQQSAQCVSHQFSVGAGNTLNLVTNNVTNQALGVSTSTITFSANDGSGRLTLTTTVNGITTTTPFWIINTDYSSHALIYSCSNIDGDYRRVWSAKLSRSTQLSAASNTAINNAIANVDVLAQRYYEPVSHTANSCFYLPVLGPSDPVIFVGQCEANIPVVQNFNVNRYLGRWRLIESYFSNFQSGTCNEATYTAATGGTVTVYNTQVINQTLATINGSATLASTDGSGRLLVTFPNSQTPSEYWIVGTDYDNYALIYSCENLNNNQRRVWSWKMARNNSLTQASTNAINQVIANINVLDNRYFQAVNRSDAACFYYPEPSNNPVVFRGQCNQNIPVVQNFDAARYMGLWHDIQSYPTPFQGGTCNNAFYSLGNGVVNVVNSQVIDQDLRTINGHAVIASTDGSAKLNVTFPASGTANTISTDYWVIATDYVSYSLVYSCRNLNEEERQVTSWKLSRTKALTAPANTAINTAISTVDVLDQRYYLTRNQTPSGCFYFPEPQPGVSVVFPGQCDTNINVAQNFNMTQFAGMWYEIETYPRDQQSAQCVSHQFSVGAGNTLNLVTNNVTNQALGVSTSTITFSANDGSGRLTLTTTVNGITTTTPFWIINTDYSSHALIYSCSNIDGDYRRVWSAKLSRSTQLSAASNTAINNAIANVDVLAQRYYEPVSHTANSCFYLPVLGPSDPVIFVGQCEANIPVVQNFNVNRYLGRWRLIESYFSNFQSGTCNEATYTAATGGTVTVYNTQVINQTLATINGSATLASTDGSGRLLVTFPNSQTPSEYWIVGTDYDNYALIYSCENLNNNQRRVWSWKMARNNSLTQASTNAINQVIANINVLDNRYFQAVNRSDAACFYYPEPSNNPVVFRGQCNQNIPVVQNFDAARYMGLWHDIQSYPTPFQGGTCNNAFYSLGNGVVNVVNSQVIDQDLRTINGHAVIASTDGSAKLNVTFPASGTANTISTDYWVIATDYVSYSLVYSCRNLNEEERQVTSWKLSRTKALTAPANTAINTAISSVDVLDSRYYLTRNQTPSGCFYFPEPQPGVSVVFPGQCDTNINVAQNFNMTQFAGMWYEIETYPRDQQSAQCVSHQFSVGAGNTLNLLTNNVTNQALGVSTSTITFSANDGSGRLTLTTTVNGITTTTPFWIINTDYSSHALIYSCSNIDGDYRRVWSAKLSRSTQLSAASNTAINNAIANVDVLAQRYYEPVSHTANSCFYLPVLGPSDPVIFVGQCEANIPVVQNFNVNRYLGRWRLIESYFSNFQSGTCNEATYTAATGGTVTVYNTQVINQTLATINGSATLASTDGSGRLLVTFPNSQTPSEYWIVGTDYDNYALIYSCENLNNNQRRVWSWKMARNNSLTQASTNAINQVIANINVLDNRYFQAVNRSDAACFYYPEPSNNPVVFRGQCDSNINVVQNFNASMYMGTWYDIQSYPTPFQSGTCNTAQYSLENGVVSVRNSQVIDQQLRTMNGTAVPAANDGSARLIVTFVVGGVEESTPYWVLATDYNSYAFVYSCRNIDNEYRQVHSWKLSRQRTLSAAANTAINNVINNVQVLRENYFVSRNHTESGCFFYPDNFGGDVILDGQCVADNQVAAVTNFNINAFAGTWNEVARFPSALQDGECAAFQNTVTGQNAFSITQTIVRGERQISSFIPTATATNGGRGVITANASGVPFNSVYILATDYNNYALAYSCRNLNNNQKQIYSWKLSRSRAGLSAAANTVIDGIVSSNADLFEGYYRYTDQSNNGCFYYPIFDSPTNIDLPGPCNESIRGVPNFSTTQYLGRWFEVARYPTSRQQGQCNRGQYAAGNNVITVTNSQVINQTLNSISGTAIVASSDGSGVLEVTFITGQQTRIANYTVLATDYNSYALLYHCHNLNNGNRRVASWKLSRTTSLSASANSTMSAVISSTQGLLEAYYQNTSQTEESCFYVPEVNPNEAPLFRGQCETNPQAMQNFDMQRYLGWWHEIERFPVDGNAGECISSQYTQSGAQINVIDTAVSFGVGNVRNATLVATSDGRLRRTLPSGAVEDVWVLATDYETYALLYSCVNVGTEYRRIWSAKHSRERQLTQAAQTAMAPLIQANRVLYPQFYMPVDQSDRACFHYPQPTGQQIIIPGQCDLTIPVVQNFDVPAYGGTWYQIESYPQIHESGTCVGARYTLNEATGVVDVLNWEVINGTLETIEGTAVAQYTDGTARLLVTLPIVGTNGTVTTTLYVLATDYQTYSLAYSCYNVNRFQRAIGAWKLSRSRTMPAAGNAAITQVMQQREELYQPYFRQIQQSENCDEPSSALIVKSSIIMLVVCALLQLLM